MIKYNSDIHCIILISTAVLSISDWE